MEVMLKRPGGDVTTSGDASSHSAKRRRAQTADVSVTPVANDAVSDCVAVVAAPPVANDVVYGSDDVIFVASAAEDVVVNIGDVSVSPATKDVVSVAPPENGVVVDSDGGGLTTANGVVSVTLAEDDVALSELTRLLDLNTAVETPMTCLTFAENTSTSAIVFQTMSTSYITINGNEESCGSSFSDNDSSVMASFYCDNHENWCTTAEEEEQLARGWLDPSACDTDDAEMLTWTRELDEEEDWDDATLARFLGEDIN